MKQKVFIIIGALVVLLLVGVWAYLLFFGTPKSADDVFAELGLSGSEDTSIVPLPEVVPEENPTVNLERPQLRQLTTKPVAGFKEVQTATNTAPLLYYVEMGTGHIFSIDLSSGEEKRLSGTTIAQATRAEISNDGTLVAIASPTNSKNLNLVLGNLSTSTGLTLTSFAQPVSDFSIASSGELLYTKTMQANTLGTAYNAKTNEETTIFSIPFRETRVVWGEAGNDTHYIYPKASYALEGFLFAARNNTLTRLPLDGFGFTANGNEDIILFSRSDDQTPTSYIYNFALETTEVLDAFVVPEKCVFPERGFEFVCPFEAREIPYEFPDDWYKGVLSFKDSLWLLSAETMTGEMLVDTFATSNREIDIIELAFSNQSGTLYFINKNDNTLWMYEI